MAIFITAVAVVLIVSFLCSIYESVLLSITRPQIEGLVSKGRRAGTLLALCSVLRRPPSGPRPSAMVASCRFIQAPRSARSSGSHRSCALLSRPRVPPETCLASCSYAAAPGVAPDSALRPPRVPAFRDACLRCAARCRWPVPAPSSAPEPWQILVHSSTSWLLLNFAVHLAPAPSQY